MEFFETYGVEYILQKVLSNACWRQLLHIQELLDFYIKEDLNEYNKERPRERGLKKKTCEL